jgi:hypothetical protein
MTTTTTTSKTNIHGVPPQVLAAGLVAAAGVLSVSEAVPTVAEGAAAAGVANRHGGCSRGSGCGLSLSAHGLTAAMRERRQRLMTQKCHRARTGTVAARVLKPG